MRRLLDLLLALPVALASKLLRWPDGMTLVAVFASAAPFAYIPLGGESNWLEGVQLLARYSIAAVASVFLPA